MRGILVINKAANMTSHDVVAILRKKLNMKRIGHTGTLDPMVTGVLPICIGNATRVSDYIMAQGKVYKGQLRFGASTTSYDSYGEITATSKNTNFSSSDILEAFQDFQGEIEQSPPIYSAIKVKGKKLYEYARSNKRVDIPKRRVHIYGLELLKIQDDKVDFLVSCSKGTYVRSLVHEIGKHLGTLAYMTKLERVSVGKFGLEDALDINEIDQFSIEEIKSKLLPMENCLYNLGRIDIFDDISKRLINGQRINLNTISYELANNEIGEIDMDNILTFVKNKFIGISSIKNNVIKMERVLL